MKRKRNNIYLISSVLLLVLSFSLLMSYFLKISIFVNVNSVLFLKLFFVLIYSVICLSIAVAILLYLRFKVEILSFWQKLSSRHIIIFSCFLTLFYFIVFSKISSFSDTVKLKDDSWEYQVMAVNFAKGHGIQKLSLLESFETYKFDSFSVDSASLNNLNTSPYYIVDTYRTPAYSLFLGLIYKMLGVNPLAAKAIQLFLLCFVAAFLPLVLSKLWDLKGFLSGITGGIIFLLIYYRSAGDIMAEVLLVFFSFLLIWAALSFNKKPSVFLSISIGIIMGILLLVKGMLIFVPVLFLSYLLIRYIKTKEKSLKNYIRLVFLFFILTMLPWSVYASQINKFILVEPISKKEIITATSTVDSIFNNTVITKDNILEVTDSIAGIYFRNHYWEASRYCFVKDFLIKHPDIVINTYEQVISFVKKEMNLFYIDHLKYPSIPFFANKYIYFNFNGLTLLTTQPGTLLLESNNEHCTDGGWHLKAKHETYYYKNDNSEKLSVLRVCKFYFLNPDMIYKIFPAKFYAGFKNFIFCQLLALLLILNFIKKRFIKKEKNKKWWLVLSFLIIIPSFLFLIQIVKSLFFILAGIAFIITLIMYYRNENPFPFKMPEIINFFLLNILLVTFIFYGLGRFTFITEFLVIPATLLYLAYMLRDFLREDNECKTLK